MSLRVMGLIRERPLSYILLLPFPLGSTSSYPSCPEFSHNIAFNQFIHFPIKGPSRLIFRVFKQGHVQR